MTSKTVLGTCEVLLLCVLALVLVSGCNGAAKSDDKSQAKGEGGAPEESPDEGNAEATSDASDEAADLQANGQADASGDATAAAAGATDASATDAGADAGAADVAAADTASAGTASASPPAGALSDDHRAIFFGSAEDPPTEHLYQVDEKFEGRHYVYGDEYNIHLFYPAIKELGGGYIGVGADQAYVFVGWQQPELAWLIDYDDWIIDIHQVYGVFFANSATPEEFIAWWSDEKEEEANALLEKELADHPEWETIKKLFKKHRNGTRVRIRRIVTTFEEHGVPSVYHTQEQFDFVKNLIAQGRVRPILANLLDTKGMKGIAEVATQLEVPIRVLYVSNAEEYWDYGDQYRENIRALPMDDKSMMIRTLSTWSRNKDYQYAVQPGLNYQGWLGAAWVAKVSYIVQRKKVSDPSEIHFIESNMTIEEATERRRRRKENKKNKK